MSDLRESDARKFTSELELGLYYQLQLRLFALIIAEPSQLHVYRLPNHSRSYLRTLFYIEHIQTYSFNLQRPNNSKEFPPRASTYYFPLLCDRGEEKLPFERQKPQAEPRLCGERPSASADLFIMIYCHDLWFKTPSESFFLCPEVKNVNLPSSFCSFKQEKVGRERLNDSIWIVSNFLLHSRSRVKWITSDVIPIVRHSYTQKIESCVHLFSSLSLIYCYRHRQAPLWCCPFVIVKAFLWWLALHQHTHTLARWCLNYHEYLIRDKEWEEETKTEREGKKGGKGG